MEKQEEQIEGGVEDIEYPEHPPIVGKHDIAGSSNDVDVHELARFAVDDYNKKQNALLELKKVLKAQQQVVAGLLYFLELEVMHGNEKKILKAKIWERLWENFRNVEEHQLIDAPAEPSS